MTRLQVFDRRTLKSGPEALAIQIKSRRIT